MKKLYPYVIFFIAITTFTNSFLYSKDIICVLPFVLDQKVSLQYEEESIILINENTNQIISTVDKYASVDGIPRLLVNELNESKRFLTIDYDMLVALLHEADMDTPYTSFATNIQKSSEIFENVFAAKYIISGEIKKFNSVLSEDKITESSEVEISINLIDIKTNKIIETIVESSSIEALYRGQEHLSHDAYFSETALGKATQNVLSKIVNKIIDKLNYPVLEATVTRVENDGFYINIGKKLDIKTNDIFDIYKYTFMFDGTNNDKYTNILSNCSNYSIIGNISNTIDATPETITNKEGEVRYTSDMLKGYLKSIIISEYVGKAQVIEVYENYSKLKVYNIDESKNSNESKNNNNNFQVELLMKAILHKNNDED